MLKITAVLFAIAALGGITMATMHFCKKAVPTALAIGHDLLAAAGLLVVITAVVGGRTGNLLIVSLALFVIVALAGFGLFSFHLRHLPLPMPVVLIHGLVVVVAFALLLVTIVR